MKRLAPQLFNNCLLALVAIGSFGIVNFAAGHVLDAFSAPATAWIHAAALSGIVNGSTTTVTGTVTLGAYADESISVAGVQFLINGSAVGPEVSSGDCGTDWDSSTVPDGTYTLTAVARDTSGGTSVSLPVSVTVQNTAPVVFGVATGAVTGSTAALNWSTSQPAIGRVEYGQTTAYGFVSGAYSLAGSQALTIASLSPGTTYHYRIVASNQTGVSSSSADFTFTTTGSTFSSSFSTTPAGCPGADPFAMLGGGTCVNGGWLPPTVQSVWSSATAGGGGSSAPSTTNTAGNCITSDPFVAMGGGTCYHGGWLPPGMQIAVNNVVTTTTTNSPGSSSSSVSAPCLTPDPFAVLGGGTCRNGGWVPPGFAPQSSSSSPVVVVGPSSNGPCPGSDPFIGIPGLIGVCANGGWRPIGR